VDTNIALNRQGTQRTPNRYRQALTKKSEPFSKFRIFEKKEEDAATY
jgi:hypothetical protein